MIHVAELIAGMFTASRYKRSQGRIARQVTLGAILAVFAVMAWRFSDAGLTNDYKTDKFFIPLAVAALGAWIAFRIVNIPSFADFLISVEAEMNKVSWPSRGELYRASLVVIVVIFLLTAILFVYDFVLKIVVGWLLGM
jgi:preprotein translocase subunit SecE